MMHARPVGPYMYPSRIHNQHYLKKGVSTMDMNLRLFLKEKPMVK